ncbi:hypothetical protein WJX72_005817 [[Myrmecia] bisecta]|uniref:RRM domain-containing protein n=1 Tax=[Myrmecia] bisecta TaxID=41462 RepID=A0AAW1PP49_9CHLO
MAETPAGGEENEIMRIGKRCYVGNLAWKTSWQDLKDTFRDCGEVVYANVMRDDGGRSKGWGIVEFESPEEAVKAVNTFNGSELAGRKILVREDREDRDVKQFNEENGIVGGGGRRPRQARPARTREGREEEGRGEGQGGRSRGRGRGRGRGPARGVEEEEATGISSGLQVVVQGIPWSYTADELRPLFDQCGPISKADVVYGRDGRSRGYGTVRFETQEGATDAITKFHGSELEGRTLTVKLDKYE